MQRLYFRGVWWVSCFFLGIGLGGCGMAAEELQGRIRNTFAPPTPGERMIVSPDTTAQRYPCSPQLGVVLAVEKVEAIPVAIMAGEEVTHHLQYAMCNPNPSQLVGGRIIRTLLFNGVSIFRDITPYEFKPGTWAVNAFIKVPASAESGVYAIETLLEGGAKSVRRICRFTVKTRIARR